MAQRIDVTRYTNPAWPPGAENPCSDLRPYMSASWQIDLWGQLPPCNGGGQGRHACNGRGPVGRHPHCRHGRSRGIHGIKGPGQTTRDRQGTVVSREHSVELFRLRLRQGSRLGGRGCVRPSLIRICRCHCPVLEKLIAWQEDALSVFVGRNPREFPGAVPSTSWPPRCARRLAVKASGAPSRYSPGRAEPHSLQRQDRGRKGRLFPPPSPSRASMGSKAPSYPRCSADRRGYGAIRFIWWPPSSTQGQSPGRSTQPNPSEGEPLPVSAGDPGGLPGGRGCPHRPAQSRGSSSMPK